MTVSLDSLITALRWHGVDEPHNVLGSQPLWLSDEARHAADERAWAELSQRGLARQRRLAPWLLSAMRVVARPDTEIYGWFSLRTANISVLAATAEEDGVVVSRNAETVQISPLPTKDLAQCVCMQLPVATVGRNRSISVREADFDGERPEPDSDEFTGLARPKEDPEVHALRALMARPRLGGGQLVAARRVGSGTRRRSAGTLSYVDTVDGRWVTYTSTDHSGQSWIHAVPGSPGVLVERLHGLLDGVR
ncbi:ESX secretion-associated protein EspG [Allokutzneria oryzae]|uniref:ESX secretion-associated protein EspG n=1 Tax=Allokutzneria oryzae TaxID=1378989 RepID=A0ABV5ZZ33_9PSEU